MTEKKKVAKPIKKKVVKQKKKIVTKQKVTMISYEIKMVIPTGQYANIQPEIVVKSGSMEDAHSYIAPHMNKLWKEYYLINERRPEPTPPAPSPVVTPAPVVTPEPTPAEQVAEVFDGKVVGTVPDVQPPVSSVALLKATQALDSCLSIDAFDLINDQIIKSVKLTDQDKLELMPLLENKLKELSDGK